MTDIRPTPENGTHTSVERLRLQRDQMEAKSFGRILFLSGLLGAAAIASIPFAVSFLYQRNVGYTDVIFPLILVAGVVALVLVLAVLVGLFKRMGLTDSRYALGLPSGSISAIIALMLILVFAMLSVLVQVNVGYDIRVVTVTRAQADQISGVEVLARSCTGDVCTVERRLEKSPASVDIGKQLVTTVSTLVVAISAFYFGSVQTANAARRIAHPEDEQLGTKPSD